MSDDFATQLSEHIKQAGLAVRRVADQAGVPHQTLYNWLKGMRPRWHPALPDDLRRLALALGLGATEIDSLLQAAGYLSRRTMASHTKETDMTRTSQVPKGWFAAGSHPADYEMGLDPGGGPGRSGAAYIKSSERPQGFATLMQQFKADAYRGRRLCFSATVRAAGVEQWAGLWMRVDGAAKQPIGFDNMQNRPITGTRDWERYAVVLDVPEEGDGIAFGILMSGPGQVWMADVRFEPVGPDVPTTETEPRCMPPDHPMNLSFDE